MKDLYIARDFSGALWLYDHKPELIDGNTYGFKKNNYTYHAIRLDDSLFPEVTFEMGPVRVMLKLEE